MQQRLTSSKVMESLVWLLLGSVIFIDNETHDGTVAAELIQKSIELDFRLDSN